MSAAAGDPTGKALHAHLTGEDDIFLSTTSKGFPELFILTQQKIIVKDFSRSSPGGQRKSPIPRSPKHEK
jgi:hypothetical protein